VSAAATPWARVQPVVANPLPRETTADRFVAIVGDQPSRYAKSPSIWNPVFRELAIDAVYVPLDVAPGRLGEVVAALRDSPACAGGNVTVPYKVDIMKHLDQLDPQAERIGAVNTVARTPEGRLVGYNTDGRGAVEALVRTLPGQREPFLPELGGRRVVMVGAGGAARAVAFYLAEALGGHGSLRIANRTEASARALAEAVDRVYHNTEALPFSEVLPALAGADLVINASTCGQTGLRKLSDGTATCLEPYSPLGPTAPAALPAESTADAAAFHREWMRRSIADIEANNARSIRLLIDAPPTTRVFDLIYAPLETVLLRQARLTGHATLNGKGMNIFQAVAALYDHVLHHYLAERGMLTDATYRRVLEVMSGVW
jgi:shikimate dehydrogenase